MTRDHKESRADPWSWIPRMEDADRILLVDALRLAARAVASARLTLQTRWLKEFPDQEPEVSVIIRCGEIVYRWERGGDSREAVVELVEVGDLEADGGLLKGSK